MKVLLSIKPEFAELILSGEKKFEFRKVLFKNQDVKVVVIYASHPVGRIIGEFEIDEIISSSPIDVWKKTEKFAGISKTFFEKYFHEKVTAFAIKVKNPKRYKDPMLISDLLPGTKMPPQSFRYI
ncbi:ASCH domain-containing protein [Providencia stuartii]|uniref:Bacteriophage protein n=1 Tax=Providencia stuartii (strain MRSN 2154) TaxID=1157951 RepID=A0A140NR02_PROSM|nr:MULTISPECIES: ASCH domain-containing protein [Providencia]AFH95909.1 bacteriophage protein [Providencia stuartii MRSN 2154]MDE8744798.1 ASCH domain-containing protein [Providencia thailandensis]MDE8766017.1 ASCH domain-containing protein [Providencia thailandensis]MDE8778248.1 ASCH domain-containing protein [Providencia thailandensis]MDE8782504.1 ASCH domain-containing protein [Providencia thailandensis]